MRQLGKNILGLTDIPEWGLSYKATPPAFNPLSIAINAWIDTTCLNGQWNDYFGIAPLYWTPALNPNPQIIQTLNGKNILFNNALVGMTNYIIPNLGSQFGNGLKSWSMVFMAKMGGSTGIDQLFFATYSAGFSPPWTLLKYYVTGNYFQFYVSDGGGGTHDLYINLSPQPFTNWNICYVGMDFPSQQVTMVINGTKTQSINPLFDSNYYFLNTPSIEGQRFFNDIALNHEWSGYMGDTYFFNRILTDTEINGSGNFLANKFALSWTNI